MDDQAKTKQQLIDELTELRQWVSKIEAGYPVTNTYETRRAEEALRKSEERLELALKGADLGMWDYNIQTGEGVINARRAEMVGYSLEETEPSLTWWGSQVHPDDLQRVRKAFNAHVKGRTPLYECEHRLRHKSGEYIWVLARAKVMEWDAQKNPVRIVGTSLDITDRKRTEEALQQSHNELELRVQKRTLELLAINQQFEQEIVQRKRDNEALRESEDRYRDLVENIKDLVCTHDLQGNLLFVNQAPAKFLGYAPNDMVGTNLRSYLAPEVRDQFDEYLAAIRRDGQASGLMLVQTKSGEKRIWEYHNTLRTEGVVDPTVRGIARDITDQRRAEAMLKASEQRLALALAGANLGIWEWDLATGKALWDERTPLVLGYEPNEFEPNLKNWKRLVHVNDWPRVAENLNLHIEGKLPMFEAEYRMLNKSGDWQWVQGRGKAIEFDAYGKPVRMAGVVADISDRKRSEEAVRKIKDELQAVIDASPVSIVAFDRDSIVKLWNPASEEIFGWSAAEAIGKFLPFVPEDKIEEHIGIRRLALQGKRLTGIEARRERKDGSSIYVRGSTAPLHDSEGRIAGVMAVFMDITEYKQAEEARRESEARYKALYEDNPSMYFTMDAQGTVLSVNRFGAEQLGYSVEELVGQPVLMVFHPNDREAVRGQFTRCLHNPMQVAHWEFRKVRKDGSILWVREAARASWTADGNPVVLVVCEDITERKQAEGKLQQSNDLLRAIIEAAPTGIIGLDLEGNVQMVWNPAAENMLGWTAQEVMGRPLPSVPVESQEEFEGFREWIRSGKSMDGVEVRRQRRDGKPIDYSIYASPLHDAKGQITGNIAVLVDITEQKSLQRQLLQAQKMEAIGTLAGGIAHDFNNLLTVILGFSDLLLIGKDERDPSHAKLQKIYQAARNGADLVQRILAFSRKAEINPLPLNLNHEIRQLKKLLTRTLPKMIEIELALSGELATVNADPIQLEQVLMNLAINAKDAMPDGGKLTVETGNVTLDKEFCEKHLGAKPGDFVLLAVSDTGHGMGKEILKHIFEPFYTTKETERGTGLGLAMVYGIVKQHDGHIMCYSEPDAGTTFKIYLPVIKTDTELETPTDDVVLLGGTETIMLVDDEKIIRELGTEILEQFGYSVLTAATGKEALDLYKKERDRISLVILDLIMPGMGGKECLEGVLKIEPRAKVLVASGYAAEGQTKETIETGARGFVGKPLDIRQMLRAVREVLDSD